MALFHAAQNNNNTQSHNPMESLLNLLTSLNPKENTGPILKEAHTSVEILDKLILLSTTLMQQRDQRRPQSSSCTSSVVLFVIMTILCFFFFVLGIYTSHAQLTEDYTNKM